MKKTGRSLLAAVFADPNTALALDLPQWSLLIAQARRANTLARLGFLLKAAGSYDNVPTKPKQHLDSALVCADRFDLAVHHELRCIHAVLSALALPLVCLKGAAYVAAGNRAGLGRLFSDIDILVPEACLAAVEAALTKAGWMTTTLDPYDQKYYRQWMHEIPPMRHLRRQTTLDVHHNILPKTTTSCPDASLLLANSQQVPGTDYWVLAPEDRVLHSAAHLFYGGEWDNGFRDLSDLDLLLREFSGQPEFWCRLAQRAVELNLQIPLYYALRYTAHLLKTPVPTAARHRPAGYPPLQVRWMDGLFERALQPNHPSCRSRTRELACWVLYLRSHGLRMPLHLLVPHLWRKEWRKLRTRRQA